MGASNTFERQFVSTFYRRPILYPDLLEFGAGLGYSKYDASTFAVKQIDFEGENLGLDLFLKWNPLLTEGKGWQIGFDGGIRGENVKSSNSLYSDSANAYLLTPNIGIRLDINSYYLKTRTNLSLSGNILSVSNLDRSALGGVNAIDRYTNLNLSYFESLYFGKWLSDSFPNLFASGG